MSDLYQEISGRIARATDWLATMHDEGNYYSQLAKVDGEPTRTLPTPELSGLAAHLYSWLFSIRQPIQQEGQPKRPNGTTMIRVDRNKMRAAARCAADYLVRSWRGNDCRLLTGKELRFHDIGIAGRGLWASHRALEDVQYWDVSIAMAAQMMRFQAVQDFAEAGSEQLFASDNFGLFDAIRAKDWMPIETTSFEWRDQRGPYQLKAAMNLKVNQRIQTYDEMAARYFIIPEPAPLPSAPKTKRKARELEWADSLHAFALHLEALAMAQHSQARAELGLRMLNERLENCATYRTDVLAQALRLRVFLNAGESSTPPLKALKRLCELQHESGGFHFYEQDGELSPELDTQATIFAVQAMAMAADPKYLAEIPGPLGRRDIALV
jgi:hypothetical protein